MILITKTFYKALEKMKSVERGDLIGEIRKHQSGLNNFIEIGEISETPVLKGYLNSKKVRIVLLFQYKKGLYFPFYIVRKETKQGYNISKQSKN